MLVLKNAKLFHYLHRSIDRFCRDRCYGSNSCRASDGGGIGDNGSALNICGAKCAS